MFRPRISLFFIGFLLVNRPLSAQVEITHPATGVGHSINIIAPDGRHWVAMPSSNGSAQTPYNLVIARQVSDLQGVPWENVANFPLESLAPYCYRLKSGKLTTWVAWQGQPTGSAVSKIQIRKVYPTLGPVETVAGSENQSSGFDLAIDGQERPCLVSFKTYTGDIRTLEPFVRFHRRSADGGWEHLDTAFYDEEEITRPEEVAITVSGNKIHIFEAAWAQFRVSGTLRRQSNLFHTQLEVAGSLGTAKFSDYIAGSDSSYQADGFLPAIAGLSASVTSTGNPVLAYAHLGTKQVKCCRFTPVAYPQNPWTTDILPQPGGGITGSYVGSTHLEVDPTDRPHVTWRSTSSGNLALTVRENSIWSTTVPYNLQLQDPTFAIDPHGELYYTGIDIATPGLAIAARSAANIDNDGDGFTELQEAAFLMTPLANARERAPVQGIVMIGDQRYLTIGYYHPVISGSPANPFNHPSYTYTVQASTDLAHWSSAPADVIHVETSTDGTNHTYTVWRSAVPVDSPGHRFLRVGVSPSGN